MKRRSFLSRLAASVATLVAAPSAIEELRHVGATGGSVTHYPRKDVPGLTGIVDVSPKTFGGLAGPGIETRMRWARGEWFDHEGWHDSDGRLIEPWPPGTMVR